MTQHNKETGAVNDFWNFLRKYFKENEIKRHPDLANKAALEKKPDFLIKINKKPKILFEFKELKESQKSDTHRDRLIKRDQKYDTRAIPNTVAIYITRAIKKAKPQLKLAECWKCPGVLVLYSKFYILRRYGLNRHDRFTTAMYIQSGNFHKNKIPDHISALAYFSVDYDDPSMIKYRIRFYHNIFTKYKLDLKPFVDKKCQHYFIGDDLFWHPQLSHNE